MAKVEPNDAFQDRGVIKLTDGKFIADITEDGEVKTKEAFFDKVSNTKGTQKFIVTRDINELFSEILMQLKIIVAQNNEVHDLTLTELDIKEK